MLPSEAVTTEHLKDIGALTGSLAQRVYDALRTAILSLDFPPGAILRKGAICEQLGVSRSPVAEALTRLATEGLVEIIPQSATRVSRFSMDEIREGAFLRQALELATVAKITVDHTEVQLTQLTRNLRLQALLIEDADYAGFYKSDEEFHEMLMEFTGFGRVTDIARLVSQQITRARLLLLPTPGRAVETLNEHTAVLDAIRARNPERARAAMQIHLGQLVARLEPLEQSRPELFKPVDVRK